MPTYLIDNKRFVFEDFDGEIVLINLEDGLYYSITDSGAKIINLLGRGLSVDQAISHLSTLYKNAAEIPALVQSFVDDLVSQGILIASSAPQSAETVTETAPAKPANARFAAPVISRFDDMQEILLLDPIHQVSEQGWPHR
ncbi:MAG: PqqD family protein [Formivibrio sp.]|nr:PqqD family protein [Formivibrio sp.]